MKFFAMTIFAMTIQSGQQSLFLFFIAQYPNLQSLDTHPTKENRCLHAAYFYIVTKRNENFKSLFRPARNSGCFRALLAGKTETYGENRGLKRIGMRFFQVSAHALASA